MPALVLRNDKAIDANRAEYVKLLAPTTSWGSIVSMNIGYPYLRGYWTMTSVDEAGNVYDASGQGRTLTYYP